MYERVKQFSENADIQQKINQLPLGSILHLKLHAPGNPAAFPSTLIGYLPGQYLVVSIATDKWVQFRSQMAKRKLVVRYLIESGVAEIAAFSSVVLSTMSSHQILLLRFPRRIQLLQLREEARTPIKMPISIYLPILLDESTHPQRMCINAETIDISLSGCCVHIQALPNMMLERGGQVLLDMLLEKNKQVSIEAHVRNIRQYDDHWQVGLQFSQIDHDEINRIFTR